MSLIPGTNIRIDDFTAPQSLSNEFVFFLTHIHTDHLKGLHDNWNLGRIYCSIVTKNLLIDWFPNLRAHATGLELQEEHLIYIDKTQDEESISVTLFDSNHCPGSVMYLFKGINGTVLHTGDFRYSWRLFSKYPLLYPPEKENEELRGLSVSIDHLIVDCTFGDPNIIFPAQDDAMKAIEDIVST